MSWYVVLIQNVELDTDDLWFVGDDDFVKAYVVITANSSTSSYTMCAPVELHGGQLKFILHQNGDFYMGH